MIEIKKQALNSRELTNFVVDEFDAKRQQVWIMYGHLVAEGLSQEDKSVQEFCQVLTDYLSLAHFSVYQRVIEGNERRQQTIEATEKVYPDIVKVTKQIQVFIEQYKAGSGFVDKAKTFDSLTELGESLAARCALEDQLIREIAR